MLILFPKEKLHMSIKKLVLSIHGGIAKQEGNLMHMERTLHQSWLGVTLLILSFLLLAGCTTVIPDEETIRSLEEQERMGVLNQDIQALERVWSEQFMVNTPTNQVSPNRSIVVDLVRQGIIHYSSFERSIEQIRFDGDIAIVMGAETVQPAGDAPLAGQTVHRRFTHIWKYDGATWRLVARHANNITP
jgi:hypothetical protein